MIPLNVFFFSALSLLAIDVYELSRADEVCHFWHELITGEFAILLGGLFLALGLLRSPEYRVVRWIFLATLLLEGVGEWVAAVQLDGKTPTQMMALWKQEPPLVFYFSCILPLMFHCANLTILAISYQMKKPYFFSYSVVATWKTVILRIFAVIFYLETLVYLFMSLFLFLMRRV